jgi:hypothetical protein
MTHKELAEATKEVVAISLWTSLFAFTVAVGIVVWQGIVAF